MRIIEKCIYISYLQARLACCLVSPVTSIGFPAALTSLKYEIKTPGFIDTPHVFHKALESMNKLTSITHHVHNDNDLLYQPVHFVTNNFLF